MSDVAVSIDGVWKYFRRHHERNQYLKSAILRGRRAKYDQFWALKDVDLEIPTGEMFGIIGSNGSGKSTLLKCLAGIYTPDRGNLTINGRFSALLELGAGFHPELTGRENIYLNGAILGMGTKETREKLDSIIEFSGLGDFIDSPVKSYSSGMTVRLGFAIAINVDPEILIIDEVLAVGDAAFQQRCYEKIEQFRHEGRTIIFVSHGLSDVARLCNRVAWMNKGSVKIVGDSYAVVDDYIAASHQVAPTSDQIGERWGSGEMSITDISLCNSSGETTRTFLTGEEMLIKVTYTTNSPVDAPVFTFRINHLHGVHVWGTSSQRAQHKITVDKQSGTVSLIIPSLSLMEGTYDVSVAITDPTENHDYDHWEKMTRFDVHQQDIADDGLLYMPFTWNTN